MAPNPQPLRPMSDSRLSRRTFLTNTTVAVAALAARRLPAATAEAPIPVIDAHVHFYDTSRPGGTPWPNRALPADAKIYHPHLPPDFARRTAPFHVVGEVVIEASPLVEDNQWVLDLARANPGIVGFIGHLEPGRPEFAGHLQRFAANPIFRGVRLWEASLQRSEDAAWRNDLARLGERGLAVDVIGRATMLPHVVRLARLRPDLRLVIDHVPFMEWDGKPGAMRAALAAAADCPNVYAKVSEVVRWDKSDRVITDPAFYRPDLDTLRDLFGPDRVVYASNWTASARKSTYAEIFRVVANDYAGRSR